MEPKPLIRKNGKFLEAIVSIEEEATENCTGKFSITAGENEIDPRDLSHYGTETISIDYNFNRFYLGRFEKPQMNKELFAKSLSKARDLGADYLLLESIRFELPTESIKEITGTLTLYVKR